MLGGWIWNGKGGEESRWAASFLARVGGGAICRAESVDEGRTWWVGGACASSISFWVSQAVDACDVQVKCQDSGNARRALRTRRACVPPPPVTLGLSAGECTLGLGVGCLCGLRACECDKQSAYCFKESLPTYEKNFKQFFSARPRCGRRKLQC